MFSFLCLSYISMNIKATAASVRGMPDMFTEKERLWNISRPSFDLDGTKRDTEIGFGRSRTFPHASQSDQSDDGAYIEGGKSLRKEKFSRKNRGIPSIRARLVKPCSYCHVPYHHRLAPFSNMKLVPCLLCGKKWVPEILLTTTEPPQRMPVRGPGQIIQAQVCRERPKALGESDALAVSEALPFLEYELARQLMLKLKIIGR